MTWNREGKREQSGRLPAVFPFEQAIIDDAEARIQSSFLEHVGYLRRDRRYYSRIKEQSIAGKLVNTPAKRYGSSVRESPQHGAYESVCVRQ